MAIKAICPHCEASFKLKDRKAVGKKVNCPTCGDPFTIKLQREAVDDDLDFIDDEYDDEPLDDLDADPVPRRPAAKRRPKTSGKPRKESSGVGQVFVFVIAGVLGIGFLVAAGFFVTYLMKGGDQLDTAYLPQNSELVVHAKIAEMAESELLKDEFPQNNVGGPFGGGGGDFSPSDLQSVTFGVSGLGALDPTALAGNPLAAATALATVDAIAVIKSNRRLVDDAAQQGLKAETHDGQTYYKLPIGGVSIWQADSRTVVVGPEASLKKAITRGKGPSLSRFSFVDGGRDLVVALRPSEETLKSLREADANLLAELDAVAGVPDSVKSIAKSFREGVVGVSMGFNFDTDIHVQMQLETDGETRSQAIEADFTALVDWGRGTLEQYRKQISAEDAVVIEALLQDLVVKRKGTAVSITATLAGDLESKVGGFNANTLGRLAAGGASPSPLVPVPPGSPFENARNAAFRTQDKNNLKQIGIALHEYHDVHGEFPAGVRDAQGNRLLSWRVQLLPFLDMANIYGRFHLDERWDSPHNKPLLALMPEVFRSPCVPELATDRGKTTYSGFSRGTLLGDEPVKLRDLTQGTSNTIAVVQAGSAERTEWTKPEETDAIHALHVPNRAMSTPFREFNVLFADGSVRGYTNANSQEFLKQLSVTGTANVGGGGVRPPNVRPTVGGGFGRPEGLGNSFGSTFTVDKPKAVFTVASYAKGGTAAEAARRALATSSLRWANLTEFALDARKGEIHVAFVPGFTPSNAELAACQAALADAGFDARSHTQEEGRNRSGVTTVKPGDRVIVDIPPGGADANADEILRRRVHTALRGVKWVAADTIATDAAAGTVEFIVIGRTGFVSEVERALEAASVTVDGIRAKPRLKARQLLLTVDGLKSAPEPVEAANAIVGSIGYLEAGSTTYDSATGELVVEAVIDPKSPFTAEKALENVEAALELQGQNVGNTRLGSERDAPGPLLMVPSLTAAQLEAATGRKKREAIVMKVTLLDGPAPAAVGYGMVKIDRAVDDQGRDLTPFPLTEALDYTGKILDITPENKFAEGVSVYLIFEQPSGIVNTVTTSGSFQLKLADGSTEEVAFDFANVLPSGN